MSADETRPYVIVEAFDEVKLSSDVSAWIERGWVPQGGVCVLRWIDGDGLSVYLYSQAMLRANETSHGR